MNGLAVFFLLLLLLLLGVFNVVIHVACEAYKKCPIAVYVTSLALVTALIVIIVQGGFMSYGYK